MGNMNKKQAAMAADRGETVALTPAQKAAITRAANKAAALAAEQDAAAEASQEAPAADAPDLTNPVILDLRAQQEAADETPAAPAEPVVETIKFSIAGSNMVVIEGSELSINPVTYDGGSQGARDAFDAIKAATVRKVGAHGRAYTVTATIAGATTIMDYAQTMSDAYLGGRDDAETRTDGRNLARLAGKIRARLDKVRGA